MSLEQTPASEARIIVDSLGRTLTLRKLDPADVLDLIEAGGNASSNPAWMRYVTAIAGIGDIDGMPLPLPTSKAQIRETARRLGDEGMTAMVDWARARRAESNEVTTEATDDGRNRTTVTPLEY